MWVMLDGPDGLLLNEVRYCKPSSYEKADVCVGLAYKQWLKDKALICLTWQQIGIGTPGLVPSRNQTSPLPLYQSERWLPCLRAHTHCRQKERRWQEASLLFTFHWLPQQEHGHSWLQGNLERLFVSFQTQYYRKAKAKWLDINYHICHGWIETNFRIVICLFWAPWKHWFSNTKINK